MLHSLLSEIHLWPVFTCSTNLPNHRMPVSTCIRGLWDWVGKGKCSRTPVLQSVRHWPPGMSAFHVRRIISSPKRRTRAQHLALRVSLIATTTTTFHRTPVATFDVQFPFANEASTLTRKRGILSASLSRPRCIALRPRIVSTTPTTRRAKRPTNYVTALASRLACTKQILR